MLLELETHTFILEKSGNLAELWKVFKKTDDTVIPPFFQIQAPGPPVEGDTNSLDSVVRGNSTNEREPVTELVVSNDFTKQIFMYFSNWFFIAE